MTYAYEGTELEVFAHANNWKHYWISRIQPFIHGSVLEVGAGIGSNTLLLRHTTSGDWTCLEPDHGLGEELQTRIGKSGLSDVGYIHGTVGSLPKRQQFDTVLYIDVLEHIRDDRHELQTAMDVLQPGGHIIVLSPAHQLLFSRFDASIGHYRRYDRRSLTACSPESAELVRCEYLDSCGLFLSLGNRILLKQSAPSARQIQFWDRRVIPLSCVCDRLLSFRFGKTIIAVWKKQ